MLKITERRELVELARELGVREDWHEPDEQDITAKAFGRSFDNAGFWPKSFNESDQVDQEMFVVLYRTEWDHEGFVIEQEPVATVNLATLFAWATGYEAPAADNYDKGHVDGRRVGRREAYRDAARRMEELASGG